MECFVACFRLSRHKNILCGAFLPIAPIFQVAATGNGLTPAPLPAYRPDKPDLVRAANMMFRDFTDLMAESLHGKRCELVRARIALSVA
jgi:hypothetical protein